MRSATERVMCYVTDRRRLRGGTLADAIRGALDAGANWVQIREKDLPAVELLAVARKALELARAARTPARILINDRLDVALAARADGVHLGGESMPVKSVVQWRNSAPAAERASFLIGVSCHSIEEVVIAARDGADYAFLGPVFETPSKLPFGPPLGTQILAEACRAVRLPVIAIGGITRENCERCFAAGAAGFASIRLFQNLPSI